MTINDLITEVDDLKTNQYSDEQKVRWINEIEGRILDEIIRNRKIREDEEIPDEVYYDEAIDMDTELLVKEPYSDLYRYYLFSMIDLSNEEYDRYQNSAVLFNNRYQSFADYWYRTHETNRIKRRQ